MKQLISMAWTLSLNLIALSLAMASHADTWRGTAPFCAGSCEQGERQIGVSDYGDGGYCVTGHKVLCTSSNQSCKATETKATCFGVVMICQNGYQETLNQVWHTCGTYACGLCIGAGSQWTRPLSTGNSGNGYLIDICKSGYVWREAVKSDHVCVPPSSRDRAALDNLFATTHRSPGSGSSGPDTCLSGYVWREAADGDHVCVTPAIRAETAEENRQAQLHVAPQPTILLVDTCKSGYVWREAIKDDHVCVAPATRSQAAADNALAAARRAQASSSDECKPGFVWREVVPSDHVCVTADVRAAAAQDNAAALSRVSN